MAPTAQPQSVHDTLMASQLVSCVRTCMYPSMHAYTPKNHKKITSKTTDIIISTFLPRSWDQATEVPCTWPCLSTSHRYFSLSGRGRHSAPYGDATLVVGRHLRRQSVWATYYTFTQRCAPWSRPTLPQ